MEIEIHPQQGDEAWTAWLPDLIYTGNRFAAGLALVCNQRGRITGFTHQPEAARHIVRLKNRALLPGLINAHSHAFQRVIRGRTEYGTSERDSFWTWREMMYSAAVRLTPEDIYDASRMAFLEMTLGGITAVGEFHYLHRTPEGAEYGDPNLMAKEVIRAARDVGLRIALLRTAYARSGFETPPDERQLRFIEPEAGIYLHHLEVLHRELLAQSEAEKAWVGAAPHSIRAVPLDYLRQVIQFANEHKLPVHMHVAEQPAEIAACEHEYGRSPVALLAEEGLLGERFTCVHAIHITPPEARLIAERRAGVCACPTTERNLGDGILSADVLFDEGVKISLGTDSHAQIDVLEDARELEYHLRLQKLERAVLASSKKDAANSASSPSQREDQAIWMLAARLFDCATINGARSINAASGELQPGRFADFFTVDLNDSSIAGATDEALLPTIVFSLARTAIRDVVVGGHRIVEDSQHSTQNEITERFAALQQRLWR